MSGQADSGPPPHGVTRVSIDTWAAGGRGLGRVDGRVWMVSGAVPGDEVLAHVVHDRGRYVEATIAGLPVPSPARRTAPCPIQAECGGCPLMPVDEATQSEAKRRFVTDALDRIGRTTGIGVEPIVSTPPWLGYRNKVELTFGSSDEGKRILGFHRAGRPAELLDVAACRIADPRLAPLLEAARAFFLDGAGRAEPALTPKPERLRLVLRASHSGDERLVALSGPEGPFPSLPAFAQFARQVDPGLVGVVRILAATGRRGGARVQTVAGRGWIADEILGTSFRVPAATFLQVHPAAAEVLARHVVEVAGSPREVLELYGGVGGFGLALARNGARVTIVEADAQAVACGRDAAEGAGISRARFVREDVARYLTGAGAQAAPDLVIADPPRAGLGRAVAEALGAIGPRRIVIVSCDPATMARDVAALVRAGYAIDRIVPFDLFPQTAHVETVVQLSRPAPGNAGA